MFTFKDSLDTVNSCLPLIMLNCPTKTLQPRFNILISLLSIKIYHWSYHTWHEVPEPQLLGQPQNSECRQMQQTKHAYLQGRMYLNLMFFKILLCKLPNFTCQTSKRLASDSYLWWVNINPLSKIICQFYQVPNLQSSAKDKLRAPYINY